MVNIWAMMTDDPLEDKSKLFELFFDVLCTTVVQSDMHTYEQFLQLTVGFGYTMPKTG